ncbi:nicotinamide mononucleotide transporter, partial [Salmonella enterica subsp. enterica]
MYAWLFVGYDLFASAAMRVIFMVAAVWGWFNWGAEGVREPGRLTNRQRLLVVAAVVAAWAVLAPLLQAIGGAASW